MTLNEQTRLTPEELWELPLETLAEMRDERVIDVLLLHVRQSPPPLRPQALHLLGTIGNPNAIPPLVDMLPQLDGPLRWEAVKAILQIAAIQHTGRPRHFDLDSPRSLLVEVVVELESRDIATLPLLLACLCDQSGDVRQKAAVILSYRDDVGIADLEAALNDPKAGIRFEAAGLLEKFPFDQSRPYYLRVLADPSDDVRRRAMHGFMRHVTAENLPEFLNLLKNRTREVRWHFVQRMIEIGGDTAVKGLQMAIHDRRDGVRHYALSGLVKLEERLPARLVIQWLRGDDFEDFFSVCNAINEARDTRFICYLLPIMRETSLERSTRAMWLLGQLKAKRAVPALIKKLSDDTEYVFDIDEPPKRVSQYAAEALRNIGTPRALAAVAEWKPPSK